MVSIWPGSFPKKPGRSPLLLESMCRRIICKVQPSCHSAAKCSTILFNLVVMTWVISGRRQGISSSSSRRHTQGQEVTTNHSNAEVGNSQRQVPIGVAAMLPPHSQASLPRPFTARTNVASHAYTVRAVQSLSRHFVRIGQPQPNVQLGVSAVSR